MQETYLTAEMAARVPTIIAKLKAERVTTVLFMGGPNHADHAHHGGDPAGLLPEWIVTGTAYTDTATLARRYDQRQWAHAFGLSPLAVTIPREQADGWFLHQWHFGTPPKAPNTASSLLWPPLFLPFSGIHMAGPLADRETFKRGMFNLPVTGGGPSSPRISYGDRGTFPILDPHTCTTSKTVVDYQGVDDMVEVWWDTSFTGPDESGTIGSGRYRYAIGGRRYLPGQLPETEADAFKMEGSVVEFTARPDIDRAPAYPPPRR